MLSFLLMFKKVITHSMVYIIILVLYFRVGESLREVPMEVGVVLVEGEWTLS